MKIFIGLLVIIVVLGLAGIAHYWSEANKNEKLYSSGVTSSRLDVNTRLNKVLNPFVGLLYLLIGIAAFLLFLWVVNLFGDPNGDPYK